MVKFKKGITMKSFLFLMPNFSLTIHYAQLQLLEFIKYSNPFLTQTEYLKFRFFCNKHLSHVQVDFVIRGLFICEFAFSYFKYWSKRPNFQSKCVFLSANSVFAVQNSGSTVRNAAGFPGDQTVGLPTLVQNPLTANDTVNPTGLGSRLILFGLPV